MLNLLAETKKLFFPAWNLKLELLSEYIFNYLTRIVDKPVQDLEKHDLWNTFEVVLQFTGAKSYLCPLCR
ncbi:hypothetical protein GDO81_018144 [Engystomops pustulosus]|uniref:Transposase n=1 Tax=Engystomops pustulosus TaxID=76066 RepID=A0AAV7AEX9_ENGPU|nr:hypothetical protein GDO81_018144 [Engystomops pustulosus]